MGATGRETRRVVAYRVCLIGPEGSTHEGEYLATDADNACAQALQRFGEHGASLDKPLSMETASVASCERIKGPPF